MNNVKNARQHAAIATSGAAIEPGKYTRNKLKDAQINHFLDFLQHGGVMQDVASFIRTVKLSTGRKTKIPNAARTVPKAEAIRLYISPCDMEGYTQMNGCPSKRTLWNILSNCPASQRKSLAGLDNVASEGSESFDMLIKICKTLENEDLIKKLTEGRRYLKAIIEHIALPTTVAELLITVSNMQMKKPMLSIKLWKNTQILNAMPCHKHC